MKRIVSVLLTLSMLVALLAAPTLTASAATYANTSDLWTANTQELFATAGTATIDGFVDSDWDRAYTMRLDRSHMVLNGATYNMSVKADYYVMWDSTNLYILSEYFDETLNRWTDAPTDNWTDSNGSADGGDHQDCVAYYITLPQASSDDSKKNDGAVYQIFVSVGNATEKGKAVDSLVFGRAKYYQKGNNGTTVSAGWDYAYNDGTTAFDTVVSKTMLTSTGYLTETAIPWDLLDGYNSEAFTPTEGTTIGFAFTLNNGNGNGWSNAGASDNGGYMKMNLVNFNRTEPPLIADYSWYDQSQTEFTITTAAELLGLVELTNIHGGISKTHTLNDKIGSADASTLTSGKTFKLGANINLNPGTTFHADGTWTGNDPVSGWGAIQAFCGTFDGCGYTVSGMYAPYGLANGSHADEFGFIGRMRTGATVKNLNLTNGYLAASGEDTVGSVVGVVHGSKGNGNLYITNVTSNVVVVAAAQWSSKVGGIYGQAYTGSGVTNTLYMTNVSYTATSAGNAKWTWKGGSLAGRANSSGGGCVNVVFKNCYAAPDLTKYTGISDAANGVISFISDAAYIQETEASENKFTVRILGLVDESELGLDSVGLKVTVTYNNGETETTFEPKVLNSGKVYKTVSANGTNVEVSTLEGDYEYAYGAVITNIPAKATDTVKIDVKITRVVGGAALESNCTYSATYVGGELQP